jgi:hypothetical protein
MGRGRCKRHSEVPEPRTTHLRRLLSPVGEGLCKPPVERECSTECDVHPSTKKLLDRLKVRPNQASPEPTTQLGSWYATALFWKPQVVLFVNEPTLLPVLVPLAPAATVIERFPGFVAEMLHELDIPRPIIDTELAEMSEHVVAKTANRSVVGMLNEFSFLGERFLDVGTDLRLLSLRLADVPCGPLYKSTSYQTAKYAYDSSAKHPNGSNASELPPTLDGKHLILKSTEMRSCWTCLPTNEFKMIPHKRRKPFSCGRQVRVDEWQHTVTPAT